MAFRDFWRNVNYVEKTHQSDGTGGYEDLYVIGESFLMNVAIASNEEQIVASQRGVMKRQFNVAVSDNVSLGENDIVTFIDDDNKRRFLRINSRLQHTPNKSNQSDWKYGTATEFEPDLRVVE